MSEDPVIAVIPGPFSDEDSHHLLRLQIAMWLPASCCRCEQPYESVDDFLARNPRVALGFDKDKDITDYFIDDACWEAAVFQTSREDSAS